MMCSRARFKELLPMIILRTKTIDHQQYITLRRDIQNTKTTSLYLSTIENNEQ